MASLLGNIYNTRQGNFERAMQEYDQGQLNALDVGTAALGETAGMLGDLVDIPVTLTYNTLVPDAAQQWIETNAAELVKSGLDTAAGQALLRLRENPKDRVGMDALMNIATILPAGKSLKNFINAAAGNTETLVRGGVIGDLADKYKNIKGEKVVDSSLAKANASGKGEGINFYGGGAPTQFLSMFGQGLNAIPPALRDILSPQAIANQRVKGVGSGKAEEIVRGAQDAEKTAQSMAFQQGKNLQGSKGGAPALGPMVSKTYYQQGIDAKDIDTLTEALGKNSYEAVTGQFEVPEGVARRYANHVSSVVSNEGIAADVFGNLPVVGRKLKADIPAEISVKNVGERKAELIGLSTVSPQITKVFSNANNVGIDRYINSYNSLAKTLGLEPKNFLDRRDTIELMQIAASIDKNVANKFFGGADATAVVEAAIVGRLKNRMPTKKGQPRSLSSLQKKAVDFFDNPPKGANIAIVKDAKGNVVNSRNFDNILDGEGELFTQQAYLSAQKEIANSNMFFGVDPDKGVMFSGVSDKHDIWGGNPLGGHSQGIASPLEVWQPRGNVFKGPTTEALPQNRSLSKDKATQAQAVTNLEQYLEQQGLAFPARRGARGKLEDATAYTKRVLSDYNAPVTTQDKLKALQNSAGMLSMMNPYITQEEQQ